MVFRDLHLVHYYIRLRVLDDLKGVSHDMCFENYLRR
jgi:hypothetical protein